MTVDAHLHVWDLEQGDYSWLTPELGAVYATFTPEQARAQLDAAGVERAVLVQAEDSERDTALMLRSARAHDWIAGVVGWVALDDPPTAERQLDRWQGWPQFRGVRHLVHDDPRDDFLSLPSVRRSLKLLADREIAFDVPDAWPRHLAATAELAGAIEGLRVVVDHLGKPPFGGDDWDAWRDALAAVAARPNTVAKLSGLQVPARPFTVDEVRPAWDTAIELFGPSRLMWGSDWPLTMLTGGYGHAWEVMSTLIAELAPAERERILSGTASAVYGLAPA